MAQGETGEKTILGHPRGLLVLCLTEFWERFSFYAARAILVLYIVAPKALGGLGWSDARGLMVLGVYQFLVYLTAIPGGIAAVWLGTRRAVFWGGLLICLGNLLLTIPPEWGLRALADLGLEASTLYGCLGIHAADLDCALTLFAGLLIISLGSGLLKPNISVMVGELYSSGDMRRDSGFTIFYMGINAGSFLSGIVAGALATMLGWHWGFAAPTVGMAVGLVVFLAGGRWLQGIGYANAQPPDAAVAASSPSARRPVFAGLTALELRRIFLLFVVLVVVLVFWTAFNQGAGILNLFAERHVDRACCGRTVPAPFFQSLNPMFIVLLSPLAAMLWSWLGKRGKDPSAIAKMGLGSVVQGLGFIFMILATLQFQGAADGKCSPYWLVGTYLFCTLGELLLSPVALSFFTRMTPARLASGVMGLYYAITGFGSYLASYLAIYAQQLGMIKVFALVAIVSVVSGLALVIFTRKLNRLAE